MAYKTYVRLPEPLGQKLDQYVEVTGLAKVHVIAVAVSEYLLNNSERLQLSSFQQQQ